MNDQLHCGHICAAAFLTFSGQLRTTSAEDFHKRERGGERGTGVERGRDTGTGGEREGERERERERGDRGTGGQKERERKRERERGGERDHNVSRR